VYNYKPRYYDERKERLEKLKAKYEKSNSEAGEDTDDLPKIRLTKDQLRSSWQRHKKMSSNRAVNLRLAIIITILVGLLAYLFEIHTLF
jgi:Flp pilus assembly protein TadB